MKGLTTTRALQYVLYNEEIYRSSSDTKKATIRAHRKRLQAGELSEKKMEEILHEHGFQIVQEKLWAKD